MKSLQLSIVDPRKIPFFVKPNGFRAICGLLWFIVMALLLSVGVDNLIVHIPLALLCFIGPFYLIYKNMSQWVKKMAATGTISLKYEGIQNDSGLIALEQIKELNWKEGHFFGYQNYAATKRREKGIIHTGVNTFSIATNAGRNLQYHLFVEDEKAYRQLEKWIEYYKENGVLAEKQSK